MHVPERHVCPLAQALPHIPQFDASLCTSRHAPEQSVSPEPQVVVQVPPEHT
jgi:hypothetical protein